VGIHFYDRRGILVYATGTASRRLVLPPLRPGHRMLCCVSVTLAIQAGEYTLVLPGREPARRELADLGSKSTA